MSRLLRGYCGKGTRERGELKKKDFLHRTLKCEEIHCDCAIGVNRYMNGNSSNCVHCMEVVKETVATTDSNPYLRPFPALISYPDHPSGQSVWN